MKNHKFQDAMDIFAKMFEGWNIVTYKMNVLPLTEVDPDNRLVASKGVRFGIHDISHIEQTTPMNGDEVWAYDYKSTKDTGVNTIFVGTCKNGIHVCKNSKGDVRLFRHVELIAPHKTLSIEEAVKMLNELTKENYKITP